MFKATMGHIVRNGFKTNGKILKLSTKEGKKRQRKITYKRQMYFSSLEICCNNCGVFLLRRFCLTLNTFAVLVLKLNSRIECTFFLDSYSIEQLTIFPIFSYSCHSQEYLVTVMSIGNVKYFPMEDKYSNYSENR